MNRQRVLAWIFVILLFTIASVAAAFLSRLFFQPETVTLQQINRDIAFTSNRDGGQWGIYVITPAGEISRLTPFYDGEEARDCASSRNWGRDNCAFDYFPSYAFDGRMLNFLTSRDGVEVGPGQVRPDGSDFRTLDIVSAIAAIALDQRFDWDPQWAVDGRIAWTKIEDLNLELYVADAGGTNERRLTRDGLGGPRDWFMSWSPDGAIITYNSDRNGGVENVYRIDWSEIDGDFTPQQLTDNPVNDFRPLWSLDGDSILFISDVDDGLMNGIINLYLMNPDGSDQRPLGNDVFSGGAAYSADGSQMVYISNESGTWSLYLRDTASGDTVQLTDDDGDDLFAVWEPVPADAIP